MKLSFLFKLCCVIRLDAPLVICHLNMPYLLLREGFVCIISLIFISATLCACCSFEADWREADRTSACTAAKSKRQDRSNGDLYTGGWANARHQRYPMEIVETFSSFIHSDTMSEFHAEAPQASVSEGLAQGPYVMARAGFEPMTLQTNLPVSHQSMFLPSKLCACAYAHSSWDERTQENLERT